jgi:hypothetical protein
MYFAIMIEDFAFFRRTRCAVEVNNRMDVGGSELVVCQILN